jgi:hypothetical protein
MMSCPNTAPPSAFGDRDMVDIIVGQPALLFCTASLSPHTHEEAPAGPMRTFQDHPALSKNSANDNRLAWPLIPFPEDWCGIQGCASA